MRPNALATLLSAAALLYLFSGQLPLDRLAIPALSPIMPEQGGEVLAVHDNFAENAVYSGVVPSRIGQNLRRFGSWTNGDSATGKTETAWFPPIPKFSLQVAGYPNSHGCEVYIEAETIGGLIKRIPIEGDEPMESWRVRDISLPTAEKIARFRIVATDNSSQPGGWVGFSQPFRFIRNTRELSKQFAQLLLCALTAAAAVVALLFPGLWLRRRSPIAFIWLPVPGFLLLAALGLLCWITPPVLGGRHISQFALAPLFAYALYHSLRFPLTGFTNSVERGVLLAVLLLASLSVSQATYSIGPLGELFAGSISRTLQVGDRSDSRIPYHVVQLAAAQADPHGALSSDLFGAGVFSNRTPLVPLAATPIVLAIPVELPKALPGQNWAIFDPEGFAAYRIVMIVIACCSLIAVFGLAGLFVDEQWALLAFLVAATTPFVVHETYFTWPKLESAWFLLLAAYLIARSKYLAAGVFWGIAYLCHPLALLFGPALVTILFLTGKRKFFSGLVNCAALAPGLVFCIALWFFVNRHEFHQTGFLSYVQMVDGAAGGTTADWLRSRWRSIANTLVPLRLFLEESQHHSINSLYRPSPSVIHFYFMYWNTLPFGVGITYFFFMLRFLYTGLWRARGWLLWVFAPSLLLFSSYWGFVSTGMLREGLHPWVLGLLTLSVVLWQKVSAGHRALSNACSLALLLRGVETLLMLLLPSLLTSHTGLSSQFFLSDALALLTMLASAAGLYAVTYCQALSASHQNKNESFAEQPPLQGTVVR